MIIYFKNREIDWSQPVVVYRNLNRGGFSIKQKNLVVAHAEGFFLKDSIFVISDAGRNRAIKEGVRNVHAYALGLLSQTNLNVVEDCKLRYNPFDLSTPHVNGRPVLGHKFDAYFNEKDMFIKLKSNNNHS